MRRAVTLCQRRVAVVLSGCGVFDGSEVHESTAALIHLDARGYTYTIYAPDAVQADVVDHHTGKKANGEVRNMMVEAARIARGPVKALGTLQVANYDALIFPGGFGVMKNLSSFAALGQKGCVRDDVAALITAFADAKKPIGAACIAPVLLAATVKGAEITLGATQGDAADLCRFFGATVVERPCEQAHLDAPHRLISAPAYMCPDAGPAKVFRSIGSLIDTLHHLL